MHDVMEVTLSLSQSHLLYLLYAPWVCDAGAMHDMGISRFGVHTL